MFDVIRLTILKMPLDRAPGHIEVIGMQDVGQC
jgi:hypothetical protein